VFWGSKKGDVENKPAPKPTMEQGRAPSSPRGVASSSPKAAPLPPADLANAARPPAAPAKTPPAAAARPPVARDDLPRFLVAEGHISEQDVRYALKLQQETGVFFGEILAKEGILGEQSLVSFLAKHCKIPHIGLLDYLIDKEILTLMPQDVCWKYHLLPVDKMGKNLTIAMVNPLNHAALQKVRELCPELRIKPILCSHEHFETVAERLFGKHDGHDETSWSEVPMAGNLKPSDQPETPTPAVSQKEEEEGGMGKQAVSEQPAAPETPSAEHAQEPTPGEQKKTKAAEPVAADTAPLPVEPEPTVMDSDRLLDSVFGEVQIPPEDIPDAVPQQDVGLTSSEANTLESIMHSYTDAMVNSMHDTYELLARKIGFFNGLAPEDIAKIFSQGKVVEHKPAEMLFDKGDSGDTVFVILNGRVKIRDGAKQIAILHTGDIFGEMALVSDKPRSATAVTMTQSDFLVLSFDDILHNIPPNVAAQLLVNIIITLAERLRIANQL